jgi:hypothetical protein
MHLTLSGLMRIMPDLADSDILITICVAHGVTSVALAREARRSKSYISRILSGQHPVTLPITRAMWRLTRDDRLRDLPIRDPHTILLDTAPLPLPSEGEGVGVRRPRRTDDG